MDVLRLSTKIFRAPGSLEVARNGKFAHGPSVLVKVKYQTLQRPSRLFQRTWLERQLAMKSESLAIKSVYDYATNPLRGCKTCPLHKIAGANEVVRICGGLRITDEPKEARGAWDGNIYTSTFYVSGTKRYIHRPRESASLGAHTQWNALSDALCSLLPQPHAHLTR